MSPNCEYLRRENKIQGFVIHMTESTFKSAIDWCNDPNSQVSYHFIIDRNGDGICLVMPENTAWHAGLVHNPQKYVEKLGNNPNLTTIGIALAGWAETGPSQQQMIKCCKLIKMLATYYNITLDKNTIIPHHDIRSDKICPGQHVNLLALEYMTRLPLE